MTKYWGKQIFAHWRFSKVGQKQKTEREKEERKLIITMASYAFPKATLVYKGISSVFTDLQNKIDYSTGSNIRKSIKY